jgi:hypothetical protein
MLRYNPRHVSSSTLFIFRRSNCIITASGIVTLCKRVYSTPVEIRLCTAAVQSLVYLIKWNIIRLNSRSVIMTFLFAWMFLLFMGFVLIFLLSLFFIVMIIYLVIRAFLDLLCWFHFHFYGSHCRKDGTFLCYKLKDIILLRRSCKLLPASTL